ncbi:MAG: HlyD family efflux transporter periplasmic adaptor subunit [Lachnospiraceae bacterium]|nr:HlyD family efflux transporter periplasmic adaptor subunit [Lachnospiraceae bacterium]
MKKVLGFLKKYKKLVILFAVIALIVVLGIYIKNALSKSQQLLEGMQNAATTEEIEARDISKTITATGKIVAVEQRNVSTKVTGVDVKEIKVSVGDTVAAGDVICVLDSEEYEQQLAEAQVGLNADAGRAGIDVQASNRNLNDALTSRDIDAKRAEEDKKTAYNHINQAAEECEEAEDDYETAKNAAQSAKDAVDNAQAELDRANSMSGANGTPSDDVKKAVIDSAKSYNSTVDSIDSYISSLPAADVSATKPTFEKFNDEDEEKALGSANCISANAGIVATDIYTGTDGTYREELTARLGDLTVKAQGFEQASSAYSAALTANAQNKEQYVAAAQAKLAQAKANYESAKAKEDSLESIYDSKISAVESQIEAYDRTIRSIEDLKRSDDMAVASRSDAVKNSNLSASTATIGDKRTIRQIEDQLDGCTVTATIGGIVTAINVLEGDVYAGGTIVTIEDTSKYEIEAEIDEYDIAGVRVGQEVKVKTNGTGTLEMQGEVKEIAPHATIVTGSNSVTYKVTISLLTPNEDLKLDMTAKVEIIKDKKDGALSVSNEAIQTGEDGKLFVEILDSGKPVDKSKLITEAQNMSKEEQEELLNADTSYESHNVFITKGIEGDYYTEIIGEGLEAGMEIVIPKADAFSDIELYIEQSGAAGGM